MRAPSDWQVQQSDWSAPEDAVGSSRARSTTSESTTTSARPPKAAAPGSDASTSNPGGGRAESFKTEDAEAALACHRAGGSLYFRAPVSASELLTTALSQQLDYARVFEAADAVADPCGVQPLDAGTNPLRPPVLPGMRHATQALVGRTLEGARELRDRRGASLWPREA